MGFFSDLWDGVKSVGKAVGRAIGGAIKGVGSWLGLTDEQAQQTSQRVGETESYDRDNATMAETMRINSELSEFKNVAGREARRMEERLIDECEDVFDKLIDSIDEINNKTTLNLPVNTIRRDSKKLIKSIKGSIENEVIPKISIDDSKCSAILKLSAGSEKQRQMKDFIDKTSHNAIKKMQENLNDALQSNIESIQEKIKMHIDNATHLYERDAKTLNDFKNSKDNESKQKAQLAIAYSIFNYGNGREYIINPSKRG